MIRGEAKEGKYDKAKHAARLEKLLQLWPEILKIMEEELPASETVISALKTVGAPLTAGEIGFDKETVKTSFLMTKDIRDKYIGSRLLWDLGELEEAAEKLL